MKKKMLTAFLFAVLLLAGCDSQTEEAAEWDDSLSDSFSQPYTEYHEEESDFFNEDDISDGCVEGYNEGYYHALIGEEPPYYEKTEDDMELSDGAADGYFTEDDFWEFYTVSYFEGYADALAGADPRYGAEHGEEIDEIPDLPPTPAPEPAAQEPTEQEPTTQEPPVQESAEPEAPEQTAPQRQESSQTVYVTQTGTKYHLDGCRYLWNSKNAVSLSYAKTWYAPCSVCHPPQ